MQAIETRYFYTSVFQEQDQECCSDSTLETIKKIAIGALTFVATLPIIDLIERSVVSLIEYFELDLSSPQEIIQLWNSLCCLPLALLSCLMKGLLLAYIVVIGPILEEFIFRDIFFMDGFPSEGIGRTILRVTGNGFLFGLAHLSPWQGWTNVPIFVFTFLFGCVLAGLREATGDIIAPATTHILNNGYAMYHFL